MSKRIPTTKKSGLSRNWLADFAYRVDLTTSPFAMSALLTAVPVAVTVGFQAWRSATADPVQSLRYE